MTASTTRVLRVDAATVVIFSLMFSPALLAGLDALWRHHNLRDGLLFCCIFGAGVFWMCGRTVELAPGRLVYRVFFTRKVIDVSNVVTASIVARPAPTLELRHEGSRQAARAFIVKPFTRTGVAAILQHIRENSPGVKLDRIAEDMSAGKFDTIARETTRAMNLLRLVLLVVGMLVLASVVRMLLR